MSKQIYRLIHALSSSEKRYFRLYARRNSKSSTSDPQYLRLYQYLEAMPAYSDADLADQISEAPFHGQLGVAKNYLMDQLLLSLQAFHRGSSIGMQLRELLDRIEILEARGLTDQWAKLLRKARKIADRYEMATYQIALIDWQLRLVRRQKMKHLGRALAGLNADKRAALHALNQETALRMLHDELFAMVQTLSGAPDAEASARIAAIFAEDVVQSPSAIGFEAQLVRAYLYVWRGILLRLPAEIEGAYTRMIQTWEAHPHQVRVQELRFVKTLFSHLDSCFLSQKFDDYHSTLSTVRALPTRTRAQASIVFFLGHHLELRYHQRMQEHEKALQVVARIEKDLDNIDWQWNATIELNLYYNSMLVLFINEAFDQALVWANRIQNYPRVDVRQDIQKAARLFSLMIHFELGNHDLLDYLSRSVRNYFSRSPKLSRQDREFFRLFNLLLQAPSVSEKNEILHQLIPLLNQRSGPSLGYSVALAWTRHQLKQAPLSAAWEV